MSRNEIEQGSGSNRDQDQLKVLNVKAVELRCGIKVADLKNLEEAMLTLATSLSRTTVKRESNTAFIESELGAARHELDTDEGRYHRFFIGKDEAKGTSFRESGFNVQRLDGDEGYLLQVTQGLSRDEYGEYDRRREQRLARKLGVERALLMKTLAVELDQDGNKFSIDLDSVFGRLVRSRATDMLTGIKPDNKNVKEQTDKGLSGGKKIADELMQADLNNDSFLRTTFRRQQAYFTELGCTSDNIEESIGIQGGRRFVWHERGNIGTLGKDRWSVDGAVITGPAAKKQETKGYKSKLLFPTMRLSQEHGGLLMPPNEKTIVTMNELLNRTAKAFPITVQ